MNVEIKQYGKSARFRLLKWLHPIAMTLALSVCWWQGYVLMYQLNMPVDTHFLLLGGYFLLLYSLEKTYHALTVGLVQVSELVYSQSLSNLIGDGFFYLAGSLYCHKFMAVGPMLLTFIAQIGLNVIWSVVANRIYYANYPAPRTAIVYRTKEDLACVYAIRRFHEHFDVKKMIENPGEDAEAVLEQLEDVQVVFVSGIENGLRTRLIKFCVANDVKGYFIPKLSEIIMAGAEHMSMFSEPVMKVQRAPVKSDYLALKRLMDIVAASIGLLITSPVMLATAIAIKMNDGGPVFYRQKRLTQNGRVFSIMKFRSMTVNAEKDGIARLASANDSRITPIGKFIRATRIDELPQLINILVGDMSLIGPRPERPEIAAEYEKTLPEFALRLQVKAGLSGVAQVYGRYNTEPYSKLQMDLMYVNKISFMTDIKLMFATVKILLMKESTEGVQAGQVTAMGGQEENGKKSA